MFALPVAVFAGYLGYQRLTSQEQEVQLLTAGVTRGDVVRNIDATGRLEAVTTVQVGSQLSGTIKELYADFNSQVKRGQVIARLEPSLFETQVQQSDIAKVAERLLSISGEDDQTVPRKFLEDWHGRLYTRFILLSNELPKLTDVSGALASRFILWQMTRSFFGKEDLTLYDRLAAELPGILNWALERRRRLLARGYFLQPESGKALLKALEELTSPIGAFLRERCRVRPGAEISQKKLFQAWEVWCNQTGRGRNAGTIQTFARDLRAALPWITDRQPRVNGSRERRWVGLELLPAHLI